MRAPGPAELMTARHDASVRPEPVDVQGRVLSGSGPAGRHHFHDQTNEIFAVFMNKQSGITLVELLVAISVFVVLVAVATPSLVNYTRNNRTVTETNALIGALRLARSEAVKRGADVSICRSNDGNACTPADVQWEDGWIVFVNDDNDDPAEIDAGEETLRVYGALTPGNTVRTSDDFTGFVTFRANGLPHASGQFVVCDDRGADSAGLITLNRTGHTTFTKGADACDP